MGPKLMILTAVLTLAACGGGSRYDSEAPQVMKGTFKYNPDAPHRPVSLSGSDLAGIKRDVL